MAAYEMLIERGKIKEFARSAKSSNPDHEGPDAVIPPTFLTTSLNLWAPPDAGRPVAELGFALARVLHGEEEYEFFGPPPVAGTQLTVESSIGDRWEKEGKRGGTMRFARIVTQYRDPAGTLVAEQRTTIIETAKPPSAGEG
jgi:hypothetical protein